jgi:hypothetical protein
MLKGSGVPNAVNHIEATDDLLAPDWQTIGSPTADGAGAFHFEDTDAPNHTKRFYRARYP